MNLSGRKLSLRADLVCRPISLGSRQVWAVKDPLAGGLLYFEPHEYDMLVLANGKRSWSELVGECRRCLSPQRVTAESAAQFYAAAYRAGVLLADGAAWTVDADSGLAADPRKPVSFLTRPDRWWRNPLAIRCPGWNPDRLLDWVAPALSWILAPWTAAVILLLMLSALLVAVVHFDTLAADVGRVSAELLAGRGWLTLLAIVAVTKILHELAHGLICKLLGGDVPEMGVIFLVGTPCLYCDVSAAWLMDRRAKRILVSAAGMLAELTLAATATLVWLHTRPGIVQEACLLIMIIGSINTLVFNGNPLLRYDGYFILSDAIGIPNLASESASRVRRSLRWFLWGDAALEGPASEVSRHAGFLWWYGVASGIYRLCLLAMIGTLFYRFAAGHEFGVAAAGLIAVAGATVAWRWVRQLGSPPRHTDHGWRLRPAAAVAGVVVAGTALAWIPLPRSVTAPLLVQPADAQPLVIAQGGRIVAAIESGAEVDFGTIVARLKNPPLERQYAAAEADYRRLQVQLEALLRTRPEETNRSIEMAALRKSLGAAEHRLHVLRQDLAALTVTAPTAGRWYLPRATDRSATEVDPSVNWWGVPTAAINRGAWLQPGTVVGTVGHPHHREAVLLLDQQQIELIQLDQPVRIRLADRPRTAWRGHVIAVAASPADEIAEEFSTAVERNGNHANDRRRPKYQVRVRLHGLGPTIPVRTRGVAKVSVSNASLADSIARFLADQFG